MRRAFACGRPSATRDVFLSSSKRRVRVSVRCGNIRSAGLHGNARTKSISLWRALKLFDCPWFSRSRLNDLLPLHCSRYSPRLRQPSRRTEARSAIGRGEGWRVPRNPGPTDNRRRRSIKCSARYWRPLHRFQNLCFPFPRHDAALLSKQQRRAVFKGKLRKDSAPFF